MAGFAGCFSVHALELKAGIAIVIELIRLPIHGCMAAKTGNLGIRIAAFHFQLSKLPLVDVLVAICAFLGQSFESGFFLRCTGKLFLVARAACSRSVPADQRKGSAIMIELQIMPAFDLVARLAITIFHIIFHVAFVRIAMTVEAAGGIEGEALDSLTSRLKRFRMALDARDSQVSTGNRIIRVFVIG